MTGAMITIGVMSGTSLDGADAVAVRFTPGPAGRSPETIETLDAASLPMPAGLGETLRMLAVGTTDEIERMGEASVALADLYAAVTERLLEKLARRGVARTDVAAIGVHGQTIRHRPEKGFTLQLNHPARVAELTGIPVAADFRARDVAAGGEGAPLVPAFHAKVFSCGVPRVILNVGGIANVTLLPPRCDGGGDGAVLGFDTGPGNMLLDHWMRLATGEALDRNGAFAATGRVLPGLLSKCLADPYFALPPPKSTGRELFSPLWLKRRLAEARAAFPRERQRPQDVAATLTELTARTVAEAIARTLPGCRETLVCGGGALNAHLMRRLKENLLARLPGTAVRSTAEAGLDPMAVEGAAFAWLARALLLGLPGNLPAVTGAAGPRILGALYPA